MLSHELEIGPFQLDLADINWPDDIQDKLDIVNKVLLGLFIVYVVGIAFSGLAILTSIGALFLVGRTSILLINFLLTTLAALAITIGSIVVTVAAKEGVHEINKVGEDVGVSATIGKKLLIITWVAAGVAIAAKVYWATALCLIWREKRRRWKPRKGSY